MTDPFEGVISDPLTSLSINTSPATPEDLMKDTVSAIKEESSGRGNYKLNPNQRHQIFTELRAKGLNYLSASKALGNIVKFVENG